MVEKTIIALIPARSGSSRIPNKNIKELAGNPLISYTINQAKASGIFTDIWLSSDSMNYLHKFENEVMTIHRRFPVDNLSPDIEWIEQALKHIAKHYGKYDYYAILRPTNPFRLPETIQRAWGYLINNSDFDSLKAVTPCLTNPYKIFEIKKHDDRRKYLQPLLDDIPKAFTYPTQIFQHRTFVDQRGFLDICKWDNIEKHENHFGKLILPFMVDHIESLDINTDFDWWLAEKLIESRKVHLCGK